MSGIIASSLARSLGAALDAKRALEVPVSFWMTPVSDVAMGLGDARYVNVKTVDYEDPELVEALATYGWEVTTSHDRRNGDYVAFTRKEEQ